MKSIEKETQKKEESLLRKERLKEFIVDVDNGGYKKDKKERMTNEYRLRQEYFKQQLKINEENKKKIEEIDKEEKEKIRLERERKYNQSLEMIRSKSEKRKNEIQSLTKKMCNDLNKSVYLYYKLEEKDRTNEKLEEEQLNQKILTLKLEKRHVLKPINKQEIDCFSSKINEKLKELQVEKQKIREEEQKKLSEIRKLLPKPDSSIYNKVVNEERLVRQSKAKARMDVIYKYLKIRNFSKAVKESIPIVIDLRKKKEIEDRLKNQSLKGKSAWIRRRDMMKTVKTLKSNEEKDGKNEDEEEDEKERLINTSISQVQVKNKKEIIYSKSFNTLTTLNKKINDNEQTEINVDIEKDKESSNKRRVDTENNKSKTSIKSYIENNPYKQLKSFSESIEKMKKEEEESIKPKQIMKNTRENQFHIKKIQIPKQNKPYHNYLIELKEIRERKINKTSTSIRSSLSIYKNVKSMYETNSYYIDRVLHNKKLSLNEKIEKVKMRIKEIEDLAKEKEEFIVRSGGSDVGKEMSDEVSKLLLLGIDTKLKLLNYSKEMIEK